MQTTTRWTARGDEPTAAEYATRLATTKGDAKAWSWSNSKVVCNYMFAYLNSVHSVCTIYILSSYANTSLF